MFKVLVKIRSKDVESDTRIMQPKVVIAEVNKTYYANSLTYADPAQSYFWFIDTYPVIPCVGWEIFTPTKDRTAIVTAVQLFPVNQIEDYCAVVIAKWA